jgi:eukaryotic-like serine/threonine-protein kinase
MEGVTLPSGWQIQKKIPKVAGASGGNFGICYSAVRGKETGFVKAIDFRRAFLEKDVLTAINILSSHALWERALMDHCRDHGLTKVVRLLDYEDIVLDSDAGDPTKRVYCLVFEIGDGDLRRKFDITVNPRKSWRLFVLRDIALALDQLHRNGVAHLDVKPSNVISVADDGSDASMKLGDLGRAVRRGVTGPFDAFDWPGDWTYAPPEKWYAFKSPQWNDERESADAYLLGNLLVFLFAGTPMNNLLLNEVPDPFRPGNYRKNYDAQLIDVLLQAQAKVVALHLTPNFPAEHRDELIEIVTQLTHPDPAKRGDPGARRQGLVGVDRYHQKFLRIARRVEIAERNAAS